MSTRRLFVLMTLALLVVGSAFWLSAQRTLRRDPDYGAPVLPGLAARLDAITELRLVGAGEHTLVTLKHRDGHWQVEERGYPADGARVRRALVALGDLHVLEAKTADPARYAALGVEDVGTPGAQSVRVELRGLREPIAVLVGRPSGTLGTYVRVPGAAQALEARPALDLARAPQDWLARTIVDVAPARVAEVDVARTDGPAWRAARASRDAAHFDVPGLPRGRELSSAGAADAASGVLGNLEFEEVRRAEPGSGGPGPHRAVVRCFDGLVVALEGRVRGEEHWITATASFDAAFAGRFPPRAGDQAPGAEQVRAAAERLDRTAAGWEYRVAGYRFDAIFRARDELLRH